MKICSRLLAVACAAAVLALAPAHLRAQTGGASPSPSPSPPLTAAPSAATTPDPAAKPRDVQPPHDRSSLPKAVVDKYDANHNGTLEPEERAVFRADRKASQLKKYDKNGDGKLDDAERVQMRVEKLREKDAKKADKPAAEPAKP